MDTLFNMRMDKEDRDKLKAVAREIQRTESDAIRQLIRVAYRDLCAPNKDNRGGPIGGAPLGLAHALPGANLAYVPMDVSTTSATPL